MSTILLITGEDRLANVLKAYLEQDGFQVVIARRYLEKVEAAEHNQPVLLLLDCAWYQSIDAAPSGKPVASPALPVLALCNGEYPGTTEQNLGFENVEFVDRSLRPRELAIRIRAALYRAGQSAPKARVYCVNGITLDRGRHLFEVGGHFVDLTPVEFDLLSTLVTAPGQTFTRTELLERVVGVESARSERTIDVHIKNIRLKICAVAGSRQIIETINRIGYRFDPG